MITDLDRQIMQFRALGFPQVEIAQRLNISQATVSQRLDNIHKQVRDQDPQKAFWKLIISGATMYLIVKLIEELSKDSGR